MKGSNKLKTSYCYTQELMKRIVPKMSYKGEDIELWKQSAREKLKELLGMDKFIKVNYDIEIEYITTTEDYSETRFTFQSEKGYRVPCHLLIPKEVENPPVMICLQGHSKGMHISLGRPKYDGDEKSISGDRDFAIQAVKNGFAAIAMEQRNFGECGGTEEGPQCYESAMNTLIMGRTTIGERIWDVQRLIDVIENEFSHLVDTKKICCMGNSGGGTATAYLAALEDRIVLAMPSCAMCTYKDSIAAMNHCSCNYIPDIANYFEMSDLMAMAYPKYYIQVSGIEDPIFPISGAEYIFNTGKKVYDNNNMSDRCFFIKGNGGHRFYAKDAWERVNKIISDF